MPIARPAASVTLEGFELRVLHLPLVAPFTTSFGTETVREVIVVRALTADGDGWGEIVTQADPLYSSEYTQGAWDVALRFLAPALLDRARIAPEEVADVLEPFKGHRMAKAGVELAVLDAALRAEGRSFAEYAGAVRDRVPSGVSVGIQRDPAALVEAFGPIPLQVDANSAFTMADADTLAELDRFDLLLIEQPLQEDDLVDHATLAKRLQTPVCLDESIVSDKAAADALALGSASVINVKAGRVGGYIEAVKIHDRCLAAGVPVWCGGMLETGIGRAANAALAALPGFTLPGDVSASARFYPRDIVTEPAVLEDGHVRVPVGHGLGVEIDPVALDDFTVARETLTR